MYGLCYTVFVRLPKAPFLRQIRSREQDEYYKEAGQDPGRKDAAMEQVPQGKYAPLSPWAYWGLTLLFSVPIVGFVFLIIFSVSSANINRRNYARSFWINLIFAAVVIGILVLIAALTGSLGELFDSISRR